ncbi:MAG TPA: ABC transporter permease [Thermoanaerobaculia bacterium]|jgi:ABC-2 type transport system permease protein|nr:ABC transporter permease [Thermoanaerobaculia bacterium]
MSTISRVEQDPRAEVAAAIPEFCNAAGPGVSLPEEARDLLAHEHLLRSLVMRDLTVRYKRSVLGVFWTMLNPLLLMLILTIVFSAFFRFAIKHFEVYFLSEYLPWIFFSQTTVNSMASMAWNGPLMKRVRIPKSIFAVAATLSGIANLVISCIPLAIIMLIKSAPFSIAVVFLPLSFLILGAFTLGVSLTLSSLSVYFADIKETYQVAVVGLMYLTPIFYPMSIVPEKYLWLVRLNPLVHLLQIIRDPIYYGRFPTPMDLMISSLWAIAALISGWMVFRRLCAGFYAQL